MKDDFELVDGPFNTFSQALLAALKRTDRVCLPKSMFTQDRAQTLAEQTGMLYAEEHEHYILTKPRIN